MVEGTSPTIERDEVDLKASKVSLDDPVEKYTAAFRETSPLPATLVLRKAVMRFYGDACVPILDESGSCVGIVHRKDCNEVTQDAGVTSSEKIISLWTVN